MPDHVPKELAKSVGDLRDQMAEQHKKLELARDEADERLQALTEACEALQQGIDRISELF